MKMMKEISGMNFYSLRSAAEKMDLSVETVKRYVVECEEAGTIHIGRVQLNGGRKTPFVNDAVIDFLKEHQKTKKVGNPGGPRVKKDKEAIEKDKETTKKPDKKKATKKTEEKKVVSKRLARKKR